MTTTTLSAQAIAGIVLLVIALGGLAIAGTLNILHAKWPSERRFLFVATTILWVLLIGLMSMMYYFPSPWRFIVLGLYFILIPVLIYRISLRRQLIHEYESRMKRKAEHIEYHS